MGRHNFGFSPKSGKTSMRPARGHVISAMSGEPRGQHDNKDLHGTKFTRVVGTNKSVWKGKLKKGQRLA